MKQMTNALMIILAASLLAGCASIVSKSVYPLTVNTEPSGMSVVIKDRNDYEVYHGSSPATVELNAGEKFFKRAFYTVTVTGDGFETKTIPVNFTVDGWYFGNLLLGGVIGMLIIDPATGAMYKLDHEYINVTMSAKDTGDSASLKILDWTSLSEKTKDHLIRIQ